MGIGPPRERPPPQLLEWGWRREECGFQLVTTNFGSRSGTLLASPLLTGWSGGVSPSCSSSRCSRPPYRCTRATLCPSSVLFHALRPPICPDVSREARSPCAACYTFEPFFRSILRYRRTVKRKESTKEGLGDVCVSRPPFHDLARSLLRVRSPACFPSRWRPPLRLLHFVTISCVSILAHPPQVWYNRNYGRAQGLTSR